MAEKKPAKKLVNTVYPFEKIYVPELKEYRQFQGGLLELDGDDKAYDFLVEHAKKDPNVSIHGASAKLEGEAGEPEAIVQQKGAAGPFVCDVCVPPQGFGSAEALAEHNLALHANKPVIDDSGNVKEAPKAKVTQGAAKTTKS